VDPGAKSQRLTMIVLDMLNTHFQDQVQARRQLLKFLSESLQPGEPVALMTMGSAGLHVVNDFTTNPNDLMAAVKKVRGEISTMEKSENESADLQEMLARQQQQLGRSGVVPQSQGDMVDALMGFQSGTLDKFEGLQQQFGLEITMRSLRQIAESFAGVPGRKSLIWATGGLPFVADDPSTMRYMSSEMMSQYEATWNALNDSQISVYPLDVSTLFNTGFVSPRFGRFRSYRSAASSVSNLEDFAKMTGGRLCIARMNMEDCFRETQHDASQYYMLGFYIDRAKGKPGWRKVTVKTWKQGFEVRARTSYYIPEHVPDPAKSERIDMETAIVSPTDFTAVPMLVAWTGRTAAGPKTKLTFRYRVPGPGITVDEESNTLSLAFAAFAKTSSGGIAGDYVKEVEGKLPPDKAQAMKAQGIVYDGQIEVPPGKYTVRFIVRDNLTGRMGTVSVPLEIAPGADATGK
jgi:VWFA-related protein